MASLARLSPESVLHNVMPIFTFMGSNVFHRDDSYSFRVIQKVPSLALCFGPSFILTGLIDYRKYRADGDCLLQGKA